MNDLEVRVAEALRLRSMSAAPDARLDDVFTEETARTGSVPSRSTRLLALAAAGLLIVAGLWAVTLRHNAVTPEGSTSPSSSSTVAYSTTTTLVGEPVKNGPTEAPEQWYSVPDGDLASVAALFGVTPDAIAAFNGWTDGTAHALAPGSTVRIPPGAGFVFNAVVPYGTLVIDPAGNTVGVGATNDLSSLCLLTATEIAGCDDLYQRWPVSPTAPAPLAPVVVRSSPMENPSKTVIYGIADADLSISVVDATGANIASATVTPAYQGRRGFAVLVDTAQGLSIVALDGNLRKTTYPAPV